MSNIEDKEKFFQVFEKEYKRSTVIKELSQLRYKTIKCLESWTPKTHWTSDIPRKLYQRYYIKKWEWIDQDRNAWGWKWKPRNASWPPNPEIGALPPFSSTTFLALRFCSDGQKLAQRKWNGGVRRTCRIGMKMVYCIWQPSAWYFIRWNPIVDSTLWDRMLLVSTLFGFAFKCFGGVKQITNKHGPKSNSCRQCSSWKSKKVHTFVLSLLAYIYYVDIERYSLASPMDPFIILSHKH
jgi:hypothetical protein